jgi:tyramine---L-glutamate ligase
MRLFVYEHVTATMADDGSSLFAEGRAMREALVADCRAVCDVLTSDDVRDFDDGVRRAGAVWIVAPETDGVLADLADRVVAAGKRLIGPTPEAIRLTSDKRKLAEHWRRHGIPTPAILDGEPTTFPVVVKPVDGCGSTATFLANDRRQFDEAMAKAAEQGFPRERMIVQEYVEGEAFSVSFVDGIPLPAMFQHIEQAHSFHYAGGGGVICAEKSNVVTELACAAVEVVPGLRGYYGVDLVYDENAESHDRWAIEINPRLTTSYIGLRHFAIDNLAGRILVPPRRRSSIQFHKCQWLRFTATGLAGRLELDGTWTTV